MGPSEDSWLRLGVDIIICTAVCSGFLAFKSHVASAVTMGMDGRREERRERVKGRPRVNLLERVKNRNKKEPNYNDELKYRDSPSVAPAQTPPLTLLFYQEHKIAVAQPTAVPHTSTTTTKTEANGQHLKSACWSTEQNWNETVKFN